MVTKQMIEKYEQLRSSGKYNMFSREAQEWMRDNADCCYEDYIIIIKNYSKLMKQFNIPHH